MRNLFLIILFLMVVFSQVISFSKKKVESGGAPVIYWLGLPNPDRVTQLALFRTWLSNHAYPDVEIRVDTQNQGISKIVIQGVAGVAGDMPELYSGQLPFLAQMGILEPLEGVAKTFGIPENHFIPSIGPDLSVDGVRYAFPCNVSILMLLASQDAFRKVGMESPPYRWDFALFEKIAKDYVQRANAANPGKRLFYFCDSLQTASLRRSVGVSQWNETLTASALAGPRYAEVLRLYHRWMMDDHLIPTPAEVNAFNVEAGGFSGYSMQLFARGNFAMIHTGRHAVVQFRKMGFQGRLAAVEPPHGGYPNTSISSRMITLFKGSRNKELAKSFMAFFSSPELNRHLVEDGDALPPTPGYTDDEAFQKPKGHENEWALHQGFSRALKENPIPFEYSPFLLKTGAYAHLEKKFVDAYMSGVATAEEALAQVDREVNLEMKRYLSDHPELKDRYEEALGRQKKIDALKERGEKIPLDLVDNAFLKKYYRDTGKGI